MSPLVRVASGVIAVLGFVAIAFNAANDGGLHFGVMTFASFFAGFIFLFAAFFGKYPWDSRKTEESKAISRVISWPLWPQCDGQLTANDGKVRET